MKALPILVLSAVLIGCNSESPSEYLNRARGIIGAPDSTYVSIGLPDGELHDFSHHVDGKDIYRYAQSVIYPDSVSIEEVYTDVRYRVFEIWKEHEWAGAIVIKCFRPNQDIAFKVATYAPYGDISRAGAQVILEHYAFDW